MERTRKMMHRGFVVADALPRLHRAAMDNDHSLLRRTLHQGCDVNVYWDGEMALHVACRLGYYNFVSVLIEHGACVTAPLMYRHIKPLSVAIENGHDHTAQVLVDKGKCLQGELGQECGFEALELCAAHNQFKTHSYLLKQGYIDLNNSSSVKWTPLTSAVNYGQEKMVKNLLEAGANPNLPEGFWPLHLAIYRQKPKIAQLLINCGADINTFHGRLKCYPIHQAVRGEETEIVQLLLEAKCDINVFQGDGKTALHLAAELGYPEIVGELLKAGADPNITLPETGDGPLVAAMDIPVEILYINPNKSFNELTFLLIKAGTDVDQKNKMGLSPLKQAIKKELYHVAAMLLAADCYVELSEIGENFLTDEPLNSKENGCSVFTESLRAAVGQPLSLSHHCRRRVRAAIQSWPYHKAISSLPIPIVLRDFLLFSSLHLITDNID